MKNNQKLKGKDLINIGIYAALYCVLMTCISMLGYIPIMMPMLTLREKTYAGRSSKSQSGKLSSKSCWRGLAKKCVSLLLVLVAVRLDITLGTTYIRDAVCIAFVVNELISITENAGLLGVPLPGILTKAIELLQTKGKDE